MDVLVIKFGTASITRKNGEPDEGIIAEIARQVAGLHRKYRIVIVSSGAVGAGKSYISRYNGSITQRKAAAAVGNPLLVALYSRHFQPFDVAIAQSLCERGHFANRRKFLQLKDTFETLWKSGIIPIVNENDVVNDRELKFSDNDELATLIAAGFGAKTLMLCTSLGGLLDENGAVIPSVSDANEAFRLVRKEKSDLGLGGMSSKLTFAKLATKLGIRVVIFGMQEQDGLLRALSGDSGTTFKPSRSSLSARNKWLGSGGLVVGRLVIDSGAANAIRKRKSLLAVGVTDVHGEFEAGEIIEIIASENEVAGEASSDYTNGSRRGHVLAFAKAGVSSDEVRNNLKSRNFEIAHANDIVIL